MRMAVFNQKGGVGKTTTALNLAGALGRESVPTLLVDLDPQAHLTAIHGKVLGEAHNSVFALYQDNRPLEDLAIEWEGIGRLIPASIFLSLGLSVYWIYSVMLLDYSVKAFMLVLRYRSRKWLGHGNPDSHPPESPAL